MKQTICSDLLLWISISPSFADGDKCCILMNVKLFWICKYAVKVSLTYGLVHMGQQDAGFAWIVLCRAFHCNLTGHQIDTESSTFLNGKLSLSLCIINTHLGVMLAVCVKLCWYTINCTCVQWVEGNVYELEGCRSSTCSSLHVKVYSAKTLNPKLPPIYLLESECANVKLNMLRHRKNALWVGEWGL